MMTRIFCAAVLLAGTLVAATRPARAELNLYEWMSAAPVVLAGKAISEQGGLFEFQVVRTVRGTAPATPLILVDRKRANRDRISGERVLDLKGGRSYLLLLRLVEAKGNEEPVYALERGVDGAREIPAEGAPAVLEAASRLAGLQDGGEPFLSWPRFRALLEDPNPILIETSLDLFLKFDESDPATLPSVRPLLDHPRPAIRGRAATLISRILHRSPREAVPQGDLVWTELVGVARRDASVDVRSAAVTAIGEIPGERATRVLSEIASSDPDQAVRYTAQRLLVERRSAGRENSGQGGSSD